LSDAGDRVSRIVARQAIAGNNLGGLMQRVFARACLVMAMAGVLSMWNVDRTRVLHAQGGQSILFEDDFGSGTLAQWTISPLGHAENWSVVAGAAAFSGGPHTQLYAGSMAWTDYTVSTRFRLDVSANHPGGLRGRVNTSTGECYAAWLYPSDGVIKLFRSSAWHIDTIPLVTLAEVPVGSITAGVFHTLSLTFTGNQIVVNYDGTDIITATDGALASGAIALDVSTRPIQFDDVRVTTSSAPPVDTQPPTVSISAPATGATVSGFVNVAATASDDVGVAGVQFQLDGQPLGAEDLVVPYALSWNTTLVANGTHTLTAVARDAAGHSTTSTSISANVQNTPETTLFADAFDNGLLTNWTPSPLGRFDHWSAASNAAVYDGNGPTQIYAGSQAWADYTLTMHVRVPLALDFPGGVRGRVNLSSGQGYAVWLYPGQSKIILYRTAAWDIDQAGRVELGAANVTIAPAVFHTLEVSFRGTTISIRFDGVDVMTRTDAELPTGAIALDVSNQTIEYDDILVTGQLPPPDTVSPTVSIATPTTGQTVTSAFIAAADATDNVGVASVRFAVDGVSIGSLDSTRPYRAVWDTAAATDGTHTLSATARDVSGNETTTSVNVTVSNALTRQGPGGPILIVGNPGDAFSRYYGEILLAEGLNQYRIQNLADVTSTVLQAYDVVILPPTPVLSMAQANMFTMWVNGGGNLIAIRPDTRLRSLVGLSAPSGSLANAYLAANTSSGPGVGITPETIQFHGTADLHTLTGGATAVARLFSDATTATTRPALTLRTVGSMGGQAAAFTYDLARSIVWTRQGNPAWSAQERDNDNAGPHKRSDDLFFGAADFDPQPDWIDLDKVAIPQADEQQRLLVTLIETMNRDRKPLPRFWYLPRGKKAAVIMTGDDHASSGGTKTHFLNFENHSTTGCVVDNWECVRGTSYVYENTPISKPDATRFESIGFEIALHAVHADAACVDWTPSTLPGFYTTQVDAFGSLFAELLPPTTNRTHCITWMDYVTQPKVEYQHGIRFDTNYYYWPSTWVQNRPGHFTGSGMPMRFADLDGTPIDVYQAVTQMNDEADQPYPFTINALLDKALGPEGYYAVVTANMHTDRDITSATAIVDAAIARGVPVVSSRQMLQWLDGRNRSSFGAIAKSGATLTFTITTADGANGLQALLPTASATGTLTAIARGGTPIAFTTETIKGVSYAVFTATAGSYQATYSAP
jgi:Bacterial Ig domain/3-keto-disaccharide hydrolase